MSQDARCRSVKLFVASRLVCNALCMQYPECGLGARVPIDLEKYRVPGIPSIFWIPDFVTEEEVGGGCEVCVSLAVFS